MMKFLLLTLLVQNLSKQICKFIMVIVYLYK